MVAIETTPTQTAPGSARVCQRCNGNMVRTLLEPSCLQCGNVDYSVHDGTRKRSHDSIRYFLIRYGGDSPHLKDRTIRTRFTTKIVETVWGPDKRPLLLVECPFCGLNMELKSLSGKRKITREERYGCEWNHKISLVPER